MYDVTIVADVKSVIDHAYDGDGDNDDGDVDEHYGDEEDEEEEEEDEEEEERGRRTTVVPTNQIPTFRMWRT